MILLIKCCFNRIFNFRKSGSTGLILSKSHLFLGATLDSIITNVDNLETWGEEIKCPSSKLHQIINVLKDNFYLEKANGKIQLKRSHIFIKFKDKCYVHN